MAAQTLTTGYIPGTSVISDTNEIEATTLQTSTNSKHPDDMDWSRLRWSSLKGCRYLSWMKNVHKTGINDKHR